jgi:hypothetical protein
MTISAHRSRLIWTPLLGWVLLSGSMAAAQDQTQSQQPPRGSSGTSVYGTLTPAPGPTPGVTPTPAEGTPAEGTTPGTTAAPAAGGTTTPGAGTTALPPPTLVQSLPSAGATIIDAPFGTSVPIILTAAQGGGGRGEELGITLGSFTLYPSIDITTGYDTNVFTVNPNSTSSGTSTPLIGSLYTTVAPTLELRSDWSNHAVHLLAGGLFGYYPNATTQNYTTYSLLADGKIDIRTDWFLTWGGGYRQSIEPLGTPNTTQASAPTVVNTIPLSFGINQKFSRFFYGFNGTATQLTYLSSSLPTAGTLTAADRGRWEYLEAFTLGYQLTEDFSIFLTPTLSQIRYLNPIDSLGQSRDSNAQTFGLGATYAFNAINSITGSVGYTTQTTGSLGATSSYVFSLAGSWNGYEPLLLRPNISRSIQQTPEGSYRNYISTVFGLDYSYSIHDEWTVVGGTTYTLADYQPIPGSGANPRTDAFFRAQIGLLYTLRPQVQFGPVFEYSQASTSDPTAGPTYSRETISMRLTAKR